MVLQQPAVAEGRPRLPAYWGGQPVLPQYILRSSWKYVNYQFGVRRSQNAEVRMQNVRNKRQRSVLLGCLPAIHYSLFCILHSAF